MNHNDMLKRENEELLRSNVHYNEAAAAVNDLIIVPADKALKPVLWNTLITAINAAIDSNDTTLIEEITDEESGEKYSMFGMTVKFADSNEPNVVRIAKIMMAFTRDPENPEVITSRGQLLVDITAQSLGLSSVGELKKFDESGMLEKYRIKGKSVIEKMALSLLDVRALDNLYRHTIYGIQNFKVLLDGETMYPAMDLVDCDKENNRNIPLVSIKRFETQQSDFAMGATCSFQAESGEGLLTTQIMTGCTTSPHKSNNQLLNLHTTVNVRHILSAK